MNETSVLDMNMTERAAMAKRVARLRSKMQSTPLGHQTMVKLSPDGMVNTDPNIVDFCSWGQFSQWNNW